MPSKANEVREVACRALCCKIVVPLLVASVVVVDHADGAGAADGRRILHHGEQLRLTVVRKGVADGHRHHVVHVLLHTIITAFGPKISLNRPMRSSKSLNDFFTTCKRKVWILFSYLTAAASEVGVDDELDRVGGSGGGDDGARRQESEESHLDIGLGGAAANCNLFSL